MFKKMSVGTDLVPKSVRDSITIRNQIAAQMKPLGTLEGVVRVAAAGLMVLGNDDITEELEIPNHPYHQVKSTLEKRLKVYPKVVWQKIRLERECVENEKIILDVEENRQRIFRRLEKLVSSGRITYEGHRKQKIYRLL
jgi:hypothetical protein